MLQILCGVIAESLALWPCSWWQTAVSAGPYYGWFETS
jgi:hypothetical protein